MGKGRSSAGGAARDDESKSPTKPFTDVHAIVFADFGLSVREPFTAEQLTRLHEAMAPTLLAAGFERDPADEEAEEGSVVYHRLTSGTGEIIEEFHIHANHVHLFVNEYRGWQVTKKIALDRLAPMWALVSDPTFGLANARLVLGYKDAFSNADPRSNSSHDVFKPNPLLPQYVFDAGLFWRYQLTLMEIGTKELPWDNFARLEVEAQVQNMAEDEGDEAERVLVHSTDITHRQQLAGNSDGDPAVEWSAGTVERKFDHLHERNKQVMVELLSADMAERIGLTEGEA